MIVSSGGWSMMQIPRHYAAIAWMVVCGAAVVACHGEDSPTAPSPPGRETLETVTWFLEATPSGLYCWAYRYGSAVDRVDLESPALWLSLPLVVGQTFDSYMDLGSMSRTFETEQTGATVSTPAGTFTGVTTMSVIDHYPLWGEYAFGDGVGVLKKTLGNGHGHASYSLVGISAVLTGDPIVDRYALGVGSYWLYDVVGAGSPGPPFDGTASRRVVGTAEIKGRLTYVVEDALETHVAPADRDHAAAW